MPHSCAVKTCGNKAKTGADLSFHRLPAREPERLKLWLSALDIDANTPADELRKYIVCSEHFVPGDYTVTGQPRTDATHRFLTPTAVPTVNVTSSRLQPGATQDSENSRTTDVSLDLHSSEDAPPVSDQLPPSLQRCDIKVEQVPLLEGAEIQEHPQVKEEPVAQPISPDMEADPANDAEVRLPKSEPTDNCELFPSSAAVTVSVNESTDDKWNESNGSPSPHQSRGVEVFVELEQPPRGEKSCRFCDAPPVSDQLPPSLQRCDIKVEQVPLLEGAEIQEHPQVKEEPVAQPISPDMEADPGNDAEVRLPKSEERADGKWNESDGSPSPHQSRGVEVFVELEQPPRGEKSCRFCGKRFRKDSFLIRHVDKSHKGHKAFKCLECKKEFEQRYQLVLHTRVHTGERPFSCDYCDKTFVQNSSRLAHMRVHTGEKPYFCAKCGKSFATSNHFKFCKMQNECKITPEKGNVDENQKEEKAFKCSECNKEFNEKHQLVLHARVHTGEKPFSCDFCGKTFTQNSNRIVHMRQHTGEKPYFCKKCGKRFASSHHLKLCTGTQNKSANKSFRCTTCGRSFHTDSDLQVHREVHESWKRHVSEKLQGQELEEEKPKVV